MRGESLSSDGAVPFQVLLEGNSTPFDVTIDEALGPMMLGGQGPLPEFDPGIEIAEATIPGRISFLPLEPDFPSVDVASTVYAGRVPGSTIDVFLFSVYLDGGIPADDGTPALAIYAFDGAHVAELSWVTKDIAPGYSRHSLWELDGGESDVFWWGPLAPDVSVVTISVDDNLYAAARPRARYVVFDMTGSERWASLRFVAYDANGSVIKSVYEPGGDPEPTNGH